MIALSLVSLVVGIIAHSFFSDYKTKFQTEQKEKDAWKNRSEKASEYIECLTNNNRIDDTAKAKINWINSSIGIPQ